MESNKVKFRIAAAVDPEGNVNACGWLLDGETNPEEAMDMAVDGVNAGEARYWIDVELEVPSTKTVKGEVTKSE